MPSPTSVICELGWSGWRTPWTSQTGLACHNHAWRRDKLLFTDVPHDGRMFRIVVIAVVAAATFDLYFLDGKYTNAVHATATTFLHHVFGL